MTNYETGLPATAAATNAGSAVTDETMTTERSDPAETAFYDAAYDAENETAGIMLFGGGGAGNRTRVREASNQPSFTYVVAVSPATEFVDSATT